VSVDEPKIGEVVIERLPVELNDVGVTALVVRMTMAALLRRRVRLASVKPDL
jgi:hypothetical protein